MDTQQYNTYRFFRQYFNFPQNMALQWCIVKETMGKTTELRLGIALKGSDLYIDVAMRRFFSRIDCPAIQRCYFPATRTGKKDRYEYRYPDGWYISKPKSYIRDIYSTSWYNKNLLNSCLL